MSRFLEAAAARAAGVCQPADRPSQRRSAEDGGVGAPVGALTLLRKVEQEKGVFRDAGTATSDATVGGMASVTERGYVMWDMFGEYTEVVALDAFDATLARNPVVEFTVNHGAGGGLPMASTRNGTLTLGVVKDGEETGLRFDADVDAERGDVRDMLRALERGDLAEASFKFRIVRGEWSPDYTQYRILEVDLERGDVSAVNFGANPHASSGVREAVEVPVQRVSIADFDTRLRTIPGL